MGMDNKSIAKQKAFAHTIPSKDRKQKQKSRGDVVHVSSGADIQRQYFYQRAACLLALQGDNQTTSPRFCTFKRLLHFCFSLSDTGSLVSMRIHLYFLQPNRTRDFNAKTIEINSSTDVTNFLKEQYKLEQPVRE